MRSIAITVLLSSIAACGQGGNDVCTTNPSRSTIDCTPTDAGIGCLGRDLGYADDNTYGESCSAPRQGDTSACATLWVCSLDGGARWQPEPGF